MSAILWLCLGTIPAAEPTPTVLPLLADDPAYKAAKEMEASFEGTVELNPAPAMIGGGKRNTYRLAWTDGAGKPGGRDLYVPGKAYLLADHVGKRVRIVGKAVDVESDGKTHHELWPARLELPGVAVVAGPLKAVNGIYARCSWRPSQELLRDTRVYVFGNGKLLVPYLRLSGDGAEEAATKLLAKRLGQEDIDWTKFMLVSVAAGLRQKEFEKVIVTGVSISDNVMSITYRLEGAGTGLGYPAETVLVDRFDGEVRLKQER